jgi:hypothetical protein
VLCDLGEELQRIEDPEVPLGPLLHPIALRLGECSTCILLGLIDDLPGLSHLDEPRQTEWAAGDVPNEALDTCPVAGRQIHRLVDAEAAVGPTPHAVDHLGRREYVRLA